MNNVEIVVPEINKHVALLPIHSILAYLEVPVFASAFFPLAFSMVKDRLHEFQAKAGVKTKPNTSKEATVFDSEAVTEQTGFLNISEQWDQIESVSRYLLL